MADSNTDLIFTAAEAWLARGYSVIPLWGEADPSRAKVAAVAWDIYRRRKPTRTELRTWFIKQEFPALAIVTGRISGIAVLDFDSARSYEFFREAYPDLAAQHVIQTRRGYHIYFRIPSHLQLKSRRTAEVDWLAEGRYVVARPTPGYRLIKGGEPKLVDADDLKRIEAFLAGCRMGSTDQLAAELPDVAGSLATTTLTLQSLTYRYHLLAPQIGRNEALFRLSLRARDHGWSVQQTIEALADRHAHQPANGDHVPETPARRRKEAVATIFSAFSRPPRDLPAPSDTGLPVSVVEALLKLKLTCVIRVIAGLRALGLVADDVLTQAQMTHVLHQLVGEWSVREALKATYPDGTPLFTPLSTPPVPIGTASRKNAIDYQLNAYLIGCKNHQEGVAHRPPTFYRLPSNADLLRGLHVALTACITLTPADVASARLTRLAIHRELFERRPSQYPLPWLARRLGLCKRTIQSYNHLIPDLQTLPVVAARRLSWANLSEVPDDPFLAGTWLEDQSGKKYPPLRPLAARLLAHDKKVYYKRQEANYYCITRPQVMAFQQRTMQQPPMILKPQPGPPAPPAETSTASTRPVFIPMQLTPQPPPPSQPPPKPPRRKRRRAYRKPLEDSAQEALAQQVYEAINSRTTVKAERISQVSARRYVDRYGTTAVEKALKRLIARDNIVKPVGFFATVLRSSSKVYR